MKGGNRAQIQGAIGEEGIGGREGVESNIFVNVAPLGGVDAETQRRKAEGFDGGDVEQAQEDILRRLLEMGRVEEMREAVAS